MHRTTSSVKLFCAGIKGNFREPLFCENNVIALHKCARDLPYAILLEKRGIVLREFFFVFNVAMASEHNPKSSMVTQLSCKLQEKDTMQTTTASNAAVLNHSDWLEMMIEKSCLSSRFLLISAAYSIP